MHATPDAFGLVCVRANKCPILAVSEVSHSKHKTHTVQGHSIAQHLVVMGAANVLVIAILALASLATAVVWPVSGSSTPDLPQSSPFGPRIKVSAGGRYDFHPGIDIPCPLNTPLHAIMAGTVTLAGIVPQYSDPVLQIRHTIGALIIYSKCAPIIHLVEMAMAQVKPLPSIMFRRIYLVSL